MLGYVVRSVRRNPSRSIASQRCTEGPYVCLLGRKCSCQYIGCAYKALWFPRMWVYFDAAWLRVTKYHHISLVYLASWIWHLRQVEDALNQVVTKFCESRDEPTEQPHYCLTFRRGEVLSDASSSANEWETLDLVRIPERELDRRLNETTVRLMTPHSVHGVHHFVDRDVFRIERAGYVTRHSVGPYSGDGLTTVNDAIYDLSLIHI